MYILLFGVASVQKDIETIINMNNHNLIAFWYVNYVIRLFTVTIYMQIKYLRRLTFFEDSVN